MKTQRNTEATETRISTLPNVQISAENFGPIVNGSIDLRPLTVLAGPSNTGKTYFATLIYALHQMLNGFPKLPVMYPYRHRLGDGFLYSKSLWTEDNLREEEFQDVLEKLETEGRPFRFMDLPEGVRDEGAKALKDPELFGTFLRTELERCFDLKSVSDLVRLSGNSDGIDICLNVSEEGQRLWHLVIRSSKSGISADGQIEDMVLFPEGREASESLPYQNFIRLKESIKERLEIGSSSEREYLIREFFEELLNVATADGRGGTHYLPAARSGIMQSQRVIVSSLVANATHTGIEHFPVLPTVSGIVADFMQRLILFEENRASDNPMAILADMLERDVLDGQIHVKRALAGGYPDFVYQPRKTRKTVRLARASSMVTELAPLVLFLRGVIARGDMLIIDEPEAHMHPEMQVEFTRFLASVVRSGVRIIMTTHSEWVLEELANLVQASELSESERKAITGSDVALNASEVGAWLFRPKKRPKGSVVEEIPLNRESGTFGVGFDRVAADVYNRWVEISSRADEGEDK